MQACCPWEKNSKEKIQNKKWTVDPRSKTGVSIYSHFPKITKKFKAALIDWIILIIITYDAMQPVVIQLSVN